MSSIFVLLSCLLISCEAFSLSFRRPAAYDQDNLPNLPQSIPGNHRPNESPENTAYSSVIALLNSLESKPSCQQAATRKFAADCASIETPHGSAKIQYAAQLAVCEFEAAGISYPPECSGLMRPGGAGLGRCLKALEERPQWWTTFSNNVQNALVICAAMRQAIEKDQLLDLHKNITKAHAMLYEVMETSLNQAWDSQNEQQRASEGWMGFLKDVNEQMANIQGGVSEAAEWAANEVRGVVYQVLKDISEERRANFDSVERLGEVIQLSYGYAQKLGAKMEDTWSSVDISFTELSLLQQKHREETMDIMKKGEAEISATAAIGVRGMKDRMTEMFSQTNALAVAMKEMTTRLDSHNSALASTLNTHSELISTSATFHDAINDQLTRVLDLGDTMSTLFPKMAEAMETAFNQVQQLTENIGDAEVRIQGLQDTRTETQNRRLAIGILLHGTFLLLGNKKSWRPAAGVTAAGAGVYMLWGPNLQELVRITQTPMRVPWTPSFPSDPIVVLDLMTSVGGGPRNFQSAGWDKIGALWVCLFFTVTILAAMICVGVHLLWTKRKEVTTSMKDAD